MVGMLMMLFMEYQRVDCERTIKKSVGFQASSGVEGGMDED
jgi:hypothetical protein